ncbi:MAG: M48 family metallopeptidase [bacterium]|nr:M48 family metallopeptidase [bacterium]
MNIYSSISANKWKTLLLMILFVMIITTVVYVVAKSLGYGLSYVGFAFIMASITSVGSYFYSDKVILATSGARKIEKKDNPTLFRIVENLCIGEGIPMPKIYVINDTSPNAFATGRNYDHAVICVTSGILEMLNKSELEGVIAHELSHIKNYDIRLMSVVAILVGFIVIIGNIFMHNLWFGGVRGERDDNDSKAGSIFMIIGILFVLISPIIATLIQLAISRKREFLADASAALLTRYPEGLASALEKISSFPRPLKTANNATAHLFIINPFKGKSAGSFFSSLFETHPPVKERIKILRSM